MSALISLYIYFYSKQTNKKCFTFFSQGDKADSFYIVESGEVKIMIKSKVSSNWVIKL